MESGVLVIDRRAGEKILIGENIEIILRSISESTARLILKVPKDIKVLRKELTTKESGKYKGESKFLKRDRSNKKQKG